MKRIFSALVAFGCAITVSANANTFYEKGIVITTEQMATFPPTPHFKTSINGIPLPVVLHPIHDIVAARGQIRIHNVTKYSFVSIRIWRANNGPAYKFGDTIKIKILNNQEIIANLPMYSICNIKQGQKLDFELVTIDEGDGVDIGHHFIYTEVNACNKNDIWIRTPA